MNNVKKTRITKKIIKDKVFRFLLTSDDLNKLLDKSENSGFKTPSAFLRDFINQ